MLSAGPISHVSLHPGGHFNFICTGVCGYRIGKLTHPQTKAGPKTDPFSDYLQQKLTNYSRFYSI